MIEIKIEVNMILAGDIGGTKTLLGLFDAATVRPRAIATRSFATLDYADLPSMIAEFLRGTRTRPDAIDRASFGVAGPVIDEAATLTNVPARVPGRAVAALDAPDAPAVISQAALDRTCPGCVETLDMFVDAYGAEAGNVALRSVSTGGLFVGGGIAPKILPAITSGAFIRAFRAKPPLDAMLRSMPVKIILNAEAGLLGAAVF